MSESNLESRVTTTETQLEYLTSSFTSLRDEIRGALKEITAGQERRGDFARTQITAIVGIVTVVMVPIFGVIWLAISASQDDVGKLRDLRVEDAREMGKMEAQLGVLMDSRKD